MAARGKKVFSPNDPARFKEGNLSFKAKLIGIEDVPEARGDQMCQETITKLKNSVKISGQHKQKIFINITLEGLKIVDAISLASLSKKKTDPKVSKSSEHIEQAEKEQDLIILHTHAVHRISFISRDTTDNRAFGYIYGEGDGTHKFFAIKTAAAAEQVVLALRDLFQVVYEMKKKEIDEAKEKLEENSQPTGDGSTSGTGQAPAEKANADAENIYQVPTNNAPVNPPTEAEQVANLLDLEDQTDHILKGIEQIKNLEFDSVTSDPLFAPAPQTSASVTSPTSVGSASLVDPWGLSETVPTQKAAPAPSSSALGDLAGLQTTSFNSQPSFPTSPFSIQPGFLGAPSFSMMGGSLPVNRDPFSSDPFGAGTQQRMPAPQTFGAPNPFASAGFGAQFGMPATGPQPLAAGMMPGMVPHGFMASPGMVASGIPPMGAVRNPFAPQQFASPPMGNLFGEDEPNLLKPIKKDSAEASAEQAPAPKTTRDDLFGDLVDIKKSSPAAAAPKSAKDLFAQSGVAEKKSLNELKSTPKMAQQASDAAFDLFGESTPNVADKTQDQILSTNGADDLFNLPHPSLQVGSPSQLHPASPPPVPQRHPSPQVPEDPQMPEEPPPPLPELSLPPQATPPVPSRARIPSDTLPQLPLQQATTTCLLPSPEEPPPPLPSHVNSLAPPPPPPRPTTHSSLSSPTEQNVLTLNTGDYESQLSDKCSPISSSSIDSFDEHFHKASITDSTFPSHSPSFSPDFPASYHNHFHGDPFASQTFDNDFSCKNNVHINETGESPFKKLDSGIEINDELFSNVSFSKDEDPFIMPFHLTPGFKAVAKFGSDPFDDSFQSCPTEKWDPFGAPWPDNSVTTVGAPWPDNSVTTVGAPWPDNSVTTVGAPWPDNSVQPADVPSSPFDAFGALPQPSSGIPSPAFNAFGATPPPANGSNSDSLLD
ncbi:disabled homolog 1-like [Physella acuta]|uniref:disabled homolog 1-like n=1 Tax=Physella acuta TaxID=109671 RepID=UPI0027DB967C|nr:disabled homolog 1-like [Physella acuta]